jgi:hypothetical protein
MIQPHRMQFTSVRTREVDGQALIGLKITAKDQAGERVQLPWVEMTPEDAVGLVKTLQNALVKALAR